MPSNLNEEESGTRKVLLTDVQALVFTRGRLTTSRRTSPTEQLVCVSDVGASVGCAQHPRWLFADALCRNHGIGEDGQPAWECYADLPGNVGFHSVDVSCEGYDSPADPYVLVGSCSLSYSLDAASPGFHAGDWRSYRFHLRHVIFLAALSGLVYRILRSWTKPYHSPPPYAETLSPPSPGGGGSEGSCLVTGEPVTAAAFAEDGPESSTTFHDVESGARVDSYGDVAAEMPVAQAVEMTYLGGNGAAGGRNEMDRERRNPHLPQRIEDLPLPAGWGVGAHPRTGERYFVNHRRRITTWRDPREGQWRRLRRRVSTDESRNSPGSSRPFRFGLLDVIAVLGILRGVGGGLRHPMGLVRLGRRFRRFTRIRPGGSDEARDRSGSGGRENQSFENH